MRQTTIAHPNFGCCRQRSTYKKRLTVLYIMIHACLAAMFLYGFFCGYLPRYHYINSNGVDIQKLSKQQKIEITDYKEAFKLREKQHAFIKSEMLTGQIFMGVFAFLAFWAYCMAAFTNPGQAKVEDLLQYRSKDINKNLYYMFKKNAKNYKVKEFAEDKVPEENASSNQQSNGEHSSQSQKLKVGGNDLTSPLLDKEQQKRKSIPNPNISSFKGVLDLIKSNNPLSASDINQPSSSSSESDKDDHDIDHKHRKLDIYQAILYKLDKKLGAKNCDKCYIYWDLEEITKEAKEKEMRIDELKLTNSQVENIQNISKKAYMLKPQRSHHCMFCDTCILEMDHHCKLMGNCIGLMNKKYYFQYGFYVWIMCIYVIIKYISLWHLESSYQLPVQFRRSWPMIYSMIIAVIAFYLCTTVVIWQFLSTHVVRGYTQIEKRYWDKHKQQNVPNPFRRSKYQNCMHACGLCGLGWLLPLPTSFNMGNIDEQKSWGLQNLNSYTKNLALQKKLSKPMEGKENEDVQESEPKGKKLPHILGLSYNSISDEFYKYACENIELKTKEVLEKYHDKINHRIKDKLSLQMKNAIRKASLKKYGADHENQ